MDWDSRNNTLIGLVTDVVQFTRENTVYVVNIDPKTFKISYAGIQFEHGVISSTCLVGNTYFISNPIDNFGTRIIFNALDLSNGVLKPIDTNDLESPPFLLSYNEETNKLFGLALKSNTGFFNASIPVQYDIDNEQTEKIIPSRRIYFNQIAGKSYYNALSKKHVALTGDVTEGLMRYDMQADTFKFVPLTPIDNDLSSAIAIVSSK